MNKSDIWNTDGNNCLNLQLNKGGKHYNVEFDFRVSSSEKHRRVVTQNDPNAVNEFNMIKKQEK